MKKTEKMKPINYIIALLLAVVLCQSARAQNTFSITATSVSGGTTFTITRTDTAKAQWVLCRARNRTATASNNFTLFKQAIQFAAGESTKTVTVTEIPIENVPLRFRYQCGTDRNFFFDVLDENGVILADYQRTINYGTNYQFNNTNVVGEVFNLVTISNDGSNEWEGTPNIKDYAVQAVYDGNYNYVILGEYHYQDIYYDEVSDSSLYGKVYTISTAGLFSGEGCATPEYHSLIGNKMYATVYFRVREEENGYRYLQVIAGSETEYDAEDDPNGAVKDPVKSVYKSCFDTYDLGNAVDERFRWQMFPHRYDFANQAAEQAARIGISEFCGEYGRLYQQKFKSSEYRASKSGSLVLDPTVPYLALRFDAGGGGNDVDFWAFANLSAALVLEDARAPKWLDVCVNSGIFIRGNQAFITLTFDEIVKLDGVRLETTWGTFYPDVSASNHTNVVTFYGTIDADPGTELKINNIIGTIKDLTGNTCTVPEGPHLVRDVETRPATVANTYTIEYLLDGGTVSGNPFVYSDQSLNLVLNTPVRPGYDLFGWQYVTPSGNGMLQDNTIIPGSGPYRQNGNLRLTAIWAPASSLDITAKAAPLGGRSVYWASFYHPTLNYQLPEGAAAYTMKTDKALYRVGNGSVIPKNCPVIIICEESALSEASGGEGTLTLTYIKTTSVTPEPGNILAGTTAPTEAPANAHVLSNVSGAVGFFEFTGTIPSNKVYYVE